MPYTVIPTELPQVLLLQPRVFADERGFFFESFNQREFNQATGLDLVFVQDNHSKSMKRTLRGLHYQFNQPQGKLVQATVGEVFDVAVDLRRSSKTFGQWYGVVLSSENKRMLWVPPGFAHGFMVLSESAEFQYKCTDYYAPEDEHGILWNDPDLAIDWPLAAGEPILSAKDSQAKSFKDAVYYD